MLAVREGLVLMLAPYQYECILIFCIVRPNSSGFLGFFEGFWNLKSYFNNNEASPTLLLSA